MTFALLDTNALIPARLADILFDCAGLGMYFPRWTQAIENEFVNNWGEVCSHVSKINRRARKRANLPPQQEHVALARHRLSRFRSAVGREWEVVGYDDDDVVRRVPVDVDETDIPHVAACIVLLDALSEEAGSSKVFLISNNVKDLAVQGCALIGVEVLTPGQFLDALLSADPLRTERALKQSLIDLKHFNFDNLIDVLKTHKARKAAGYMAKLACQPG